MSLNRSEQMIMDYVQSHAEERQYWQEKVRSTVRTCVNDAEAASLLDTDLWYYFRERSQVVEPFKGFAKREGLQRTSMKNLAEYWIRVWMPPRPKKKKTELEKRP